MPLAGAYLLEDHNKLQVPKCRRGYARNGVDRTMPTAHEQAKSNLTRVLTSGLGPMSLMSDTV